MHLNPVHPTAADRVAVRRWRGAALLVTVVLVAGACSSDSEGSSSAPDTTAASTEASTSQEFSGTLVEVTAEEGPFSYDDAAPVGAEMAASVATSEDETTYELTVSGMAPDRGYAVHAHTKPCGVTGDLAGPHFQHEVDPAATPDEPSSDPEYANPENEVWIDLKTDSEGAGTAEATVPFGFTDSAPKSIVVHADMMTMTEPGMAGMAGDRIACLDAPVS